MKYVDEIFSTLDKIVPTLDVPIIELIESQTKDPFKILVATLLSARTKDQTTAEVCKRLFKVINTPADLTKKSVAQIEKLIFPVGFYKNKAKYLKKLPTVLQEEFQGIIPETVDELVRLPGVGRKTANLVVAVAFKKPAICVDIHVHRISNRFGWVKTKTPFETEMTLRKKLPSKYWLKINWYLVAYGQSLCTPISPWCSLCSIKKYCKQKNVTTTR
jgi:endonuclease III